VWASAVSALLGVLGVERAEPKGDDVTDRVDPEKKPPQPKKVARGPDSPPAAPASPPPPPVVLARPYAPPIQGAVADAPRVRRVLIVGISGGIGTLLMRRLLATGPDRWKIAGLSRDDLEDPLRSKIEFIKADLTQNRAEDVFRRGDIDTVVHCAFDDDVRVPTAVRYKSNVLGTMRLLDWSARYGVRKVVVVSSAAVYGALQENAMHLTEESPTRADLAYAAIRDRVEADRYAVAWMWKYPEVETSILRPVHVIGRTAKSPFQRYISLKYVPVLLGFDPLMQVVHEDDVVRAVQIALEKDASGVFNIAGPGAIPLREILREVGSEPVPLPHVGGVQLVSLLGRLGITPFGAPAARADFVKYPMIVSGEKARKELGYAAEVPLRDTIRAARRGAG
jgi:UDP-glucose 4-epimerase